MKRLLTITVLTLITIGTGVSSAATLKPIADAGDWASGPIFATAPPDDPRVFVVERGEGPPSNSAAIRVVKDGVLQPTPFLTVPNVDVVSERGLLSMAFAPDYATSGLFYVFWIANGPDALDGTGAAGDIRIVEFKRSASDPDIADPASARMVFETNHGAGNHNGGWMGFGPDDLLYFTIGDNAIQSNAQDVGNVFGKVLRIDPAGTSPGEYGIPSGNPFGGPGDPFPGGRQEIYIYGLRNPYRASFAPDGRLVIGDVGAGQTEEVDVLVSASAGKNMGWPICEGFCGSPNPALTEPFFEYGHDNGPTPAPGTGNVIIGGYVVRDPDLTGLTGRYLYGDNARSDLRTLNLSVPGGDPVDPGLSVGQYSLVSFGEDSRGCVYVMADGTVYRVAAGAAAPTACPLTDDPPDPPDPPVDTTKPSLALDSKGQRLGKKISFSATCSEKCTIRGKGALKAKRRGKKKAVGFKYTAASRDAEANQKVKVVLKLGPKALKNARKVLRNGRKLNAVLVVTATDPSGNSRSIKFTVKVRRAAPR